ncbi:hypothetical protein WG904_15735 [Pedobacter sp. Du54]|uniref:hypothetical protein n=1 Tax=Pedobacter anseongensis TaxID=3133439 RepID=UPI0030A04EC4
MGNFKRVKTSVCLILLISLFYESAHAQLGRGCYVGGVLYTTNTSKGNRFFYRSPGNITNVCGYTPTGNDGNCRLYNSGPLGNNNSYTLYSDAFSNDWAEINCPIDDYVWLLMLSAVGLSVWRFRKVTFA